MAAPAPSSAADVAPDVTATAPVGSVIQENSRRVLDGSTVFMADDVKRWRNWKKEPAEVTAKFPHAAPRRPQPFRAESLGYTRFALYRYSSAAEKAMDAAKREAQAALQRARAEEVALCAKYGTTPSFAKGAVAMESRAVPPLVSGESQLLVAWRVKETDPELCTGIDEEDLENVEE